MILIKVGGGKQINFDYIAKDVARLIRHREKVVIVHGASATRDEIAKKLGIPTKTITSPSGVTSVFTDANAIDVFLMVYCGLANKKIVTVLQRYGINAVGFCGVDGKLWEAKRKTAVYSVEKGKTKLIQDNMTGKVEKINTNLVRILLDNNFIPVICPPAISFDKKIVNVDGDAAAVTLAIALDIQQLIFLFEAPGLLKNYQDENSVIKNIDKKNIQELLQFANGRMKKKVLATQKALELGIKEVFFGDGRIKNPITHALQGGGTIIV